MYFRSADLLKSEMSADNVVSEWRVDEMMKMTILANRPAALKRVFEAGFKYQRAEVDAISAILELGKDQKDTRRAFSIGFIAAKLFPQAEHVSEFQAECEKIFDKPIASLSAAERRARDASRQAWSRILQRADVQTEERRGGARIRAGASSEDADAQRTPTRFYCTTCSDVMPCRSLRPTESYDYGDQQTGVMTDEETHWHQRIRRCEECGTEFMTCEIARTTLDEWQGKLQLLMAASDGISSVHDQVIALKMKLSGC